MFLARQTGNVFAPESSAELLMLTFLSAITQLTFAFSPITVSCISIEFLTTAPFSTLTPLKIMQFSTCPSIMHPSATSEFLVAIQARKE